jgi:membrane fusion protein, multidrug efflux system
MLKNTGFQKHTVYLAALFFTAICLSGCSQADKKPEVDTIPVRVMKIKLQDIKEILAYTGDVKAHDEAVVYPKVNGKIIEKLKEDGSRVNKGEVIAYIDRDEVGFEFNKAPVESPLTGIIGRVYVDRGTNVSPQTPVALVVDMDKVKIGLDIPGKYLPRIAMGQQAEVSVDAYPDKVFEGKVSKISPIVDLDTRTAPIEIMVDNPDYYLRPGMYARAGLVLDNRKSVPVVLKEAVSGKAPENYVFVVNGNTANKKNIELGIRQGAYFEVTSGLEQGDLVVMMGQQRLRDKAKVKAEGDEE